MDMLARKSSDGSFKYMSNKRKTEGDVNLMLNRRRTVVTGYREGRVTDCFLCISFH